MSADGAVTGVIALRRTALGTSTATITRFTSVGSYTLTLPAAPHLTLTGTTQFEVVGEAQRTLTVEHLADTLHAGDSVSTFTVTVRNRADALVAHAPMLASNGVRLVTTGATVNVLVQNPSLGVYHLSTTSILTTAGTYRLVVSGIPDSAVVDTFGAKKRLVVAPIYASSATFTLTTSAMTATGGNVTLTVSYRDRYNNLTDDIARVHFDNREFDTTGVFDLVRQSKGVYKATQTFLTPGTYTLALEQITNPETGLPFTAELRGRNAFGLEPGPATEAAFDGVVPSLVAGAQQAAFTVTLFDRNGLPTDYIRGGNVVRFTGAATGTIAGEFLSPGNLNAYNVLTATPTAFTTVGNYTLSIQGVTAARHTGTRTFTVTPAPAIRVASTSLNVAGVIMSKSTTQIISVRAANLSAPITITPPADFAISVTGAAPFYTMPFTVQPSANGAVTLTVRFTPSAVGMRSGTLRLESGNVTTTVALTGEGIASEPTRVRFVNERLIVRDEQYFPLGWSMIGTRGVHLTRNTQARFPGMNFIENEGIFLHQSIGAGREVWGSNGNEADSVKNFINNTKLYLDTCHAIGSKTLVNLYEYYTDKVSNGVSVMNANNRIVTFSKLFDRNDIKQIVSDTSLRNHPALLGWTISSEPAGKYSQLFNKIYTSLTTANQNDVLGLPLSSTRAGVTAEISKYYYTQSGLQSLYNDIKTSGGGQHLLFTMHQTGSVHEMTTVREIYGNPSQRFFDGIQTEYYSSYTSTTATVVEMMFERKTPFNDPIQVGNGNTGVNLSKPNVWPNVMGNYYYRRFPIAAPGVAMNQDYRMMRGDVQEHYDQFFPTSSSNSGMIQKLYAHPFEGEESAGIMRPPTAGELLHQFFIKIYALQEAPRPMNLAGMMIFGYDFFYQPVPPNSKNFVLSSTGAIKKDALQNAIAFIGKHNLGLALQEPKIPTETVESLLRVRVGAGMSADEHSAEQAIKRIVRYHNGSYYVVLINTRLNEASLAITPTTNLGTGWGGTQQFLGTDNVTVYVPDNALVATCTELTPFSGGSGLNGGGTQNIALSPTTLAGVGARQMFTLGTLAPAAVRVFRLQVAHPAVTVGTAPTVAQQMQKPNASAATMVATSAAADSAQRTITQQMNAQQAALGQRLSVTPNPAVNAFSVIVVVPEMHDAVQITITDVKGSVIAAWRSSAALSAGTHTIPFDAQQMPSGAYFCTLQTPNGRSTVLFHVLK